MRSSRPDHYVLTLPSHSVRYWLVSMHVSAALAQAAGIAKYAMPASNTSCRITARAMVALVLLHDVRKLYWYIDCDIRSPVGS